MKYRTIVADPPWDHSDGTGWNPGKAHFDPAKRGRGTPRETGLPYGTMSVEQIATLDVARLAERDAFLFLWTTNRFLEASYLIARTWGFEPVKPIVWVKPPNAGFIGGTFGGASVEFCLYARRGNARALDRAGRQWFDWPRLEHSQKPDAFIDVVEQTHPGPYLEMFARRARFGWDYWGDQSLNTVEVAA